MPAGAHTRAASAVDRLPGQVSYLIGSDTRHWLTGIPTFGRIVYSQFGTAFNWPFGAALSVILATVVIVAIGLGGRFGRRRGAV